jgi:hypothetical protein
MEVKINQSLNKYNKPVIERFNTSNYEQNTNNVNSAKVTNPTKSQSFHFLNFGGVNQNKKQMSFHQTIKNYAGSDLVLRENLNYNNDIYEVPSIIRTLVNLGYSLESINMTQKRYKFKTLQQALNIMNIDETSGKYQHSFFPQTNNSNRKDGGNFHNSSNSEIANMNTMTMNDIVKKPQANDAEQFSINKNCILNIKNIQNDLCIICNDIREKHFDYGETIYDPLELINVNQHDKYNNSIGSRNFSDNSGNFKEKSAHNLSDMSSRNIYDSSTKNAENKNNINNLVKKFEKDFLGKELCIICYENEVGGKKQTDVFHLECGHKFCTKCVNNYLTSLINEAKVVNIKCLQAGCQMSYTDEDIKSNVEPDIFEKFKKFKKRNSFLEKLQRGMIPCISPDCEEWVSFREGDNIFVKCELGHEFCALCKGKWHIGKQCQDVSFFNFLERV